MKKVLLALAVAVLFSGVAMASTPIQLSLWDKIAIPVNDSVTGLEIGIGNNLQSVTGLQWNFIWSKTENAPLAWQSAIVNQVGGKLTGIQSGFVNYNSGSVTGLQWGCVNYQDGFTGLQFGFINYSKSLKGISLGFINYAESADSFALQIGLVNYLGNSVIYKWFPFINLKV
ncbi:MAG: hypothetical protein FWC57_03465 [Endomicrobia bacterium]|nr:hypothetical protein [Endomicrobiia bacterium]